KEKHLKRFSKEFFLWEGRTNRIAQRLQRYFLAVLSGMLIRPSTGSKDKECLTGSSTSSAIRRGQSQSMLRYDFATVRHPGSRSAKIRVRNVCRALLVPPLFRSRPADAFRAESGCGTPALHVPAGIRSQSRRRGSRASLFCLSRCSALSETSPDYLQQNVDTRAS